MTSEAHITTIDPEIAGQATLPPAPASGVLLVHVPSDFGDVCAWHLLDFARRWRDEGRQVHLCDACLDEPCLHHAADVENAEGVTDAILYGSSTARISVRVEKDVMLTTAGTVVGDPMRVLEHPRWASIAASVTDAGGMFVVTVPSGTESSRLDGLADAVLRFVPGGVSGAETRRSSPTPSSPPPEAESDRTAAADAVRSAVEPAARTSPANSPSRGTPATTSREKSGGRGLVIFILILLVLLGAFGAGYFGLLDIPGITPIDVDPMIDLFPLR